MNVYKYVKKEEVMYRINYKVRSTRYGPRIEYTTFFYEAEAKTIRPSIPFNITQVVQPIITKGMSFDTKHWKPKTYRSHQILSRFTCSMLRWNYLIESSDYYFNHFSHSSDDFKEHCVIERS